MVTIILFLIVTSFKGMYYEIIVYLQCSQVNDVLVVISLKIATIYRKPYYDYYIIILEPIY